MVSRISVTVLALNDTTASQLLTVLHPNTFNNQSGCDPLLFCGKTGEQ